MEVPLLELSGRVPLVRLPEIEAEQYATAQWGVYNKKAVAAGSRHGCQSMVSYST